MSDLGITPLYHPRDMMMIYDGGAEITELERRFTAILGVREVEGEFRLNDLIRLCNFLVNEKRKKTITLLPLSRCKMNKLSLDEGEMRAIVDEEYIYVTPSDEFFGPEDDMEPLEKFLYRNNLLRYINREESLI